MHSREELYQFHDPTTPADVRARLADYYGAQSFTAGLVAAHPDVGRIADMKTADYHWRYLDPQDALEVVQTQRQVGALFGVDPQAVERAVRVRQKATRELGDRYGDEG